MTKLVLVSAFIFFAAVNANAVPAVGDTAYYKGTFDGKKAHSLMTLIAFNNKTNQFREKFIFYVKGKKPQVQIDWVDASDLPSDSTLQDQLKNCTNSSGTLETVTVPAGTFATCRVGAPSSGIMNIGLVPFGTVKSNIPLMDGGADDMYLTSFSRGGP